MPRLEVEKHDDSVTLQVVYDNPARKVYLGTFTNGQYDALRVYFVSEFLNQDADKTFEELVTKYASV